MKKKIKRFISKKKKYIFQTEHTLPNLKKFWNS